MANKFEHKFKIYDTTAQVRNRIETKQSKNEK